MRSRYAAFVTANVDYLIDTVHPDKRKDHDANHVRKWASQSDWLGLEIKECTGGGPEESEGTVEFVATYRQDGKRRTHPEIASFRKQEDRWFFYDGAAPALETVRRTQPKVGRNDPCPCGSGKKYKKCCA